MGIFETDAISKEVQDIWLLYKPYIYKLCAYKLSSKQDCIDDCVQEVFLALMQAKRNGAIIEHHKNWLTVVANNKIKDIYERGRKESMKIISDSAEIDRYTYYENFDICNVSDDDIDKLKDKVISQLTEIEQMLIDDYYVKRMRTKEIAEKHMITQTNVKQKLYRTRKKIIDLTKKEVENYSV